MIIQKGKRNTAVIYTDKIDKQTKTQIASILRESAYADSKIRFMPDVHAGRHVPVGTTMTLCGRISPTLLGSDIGCGIDVTVIRECDVDFRKLDAFVHAHIPCGAKIHDRPITEYTLDQLYCRAHVGASRALCSIGTLGGGNHFIELDRCRDGTLLLVVHSGSRQLGSDVMQHYQKAAFRAYCKKERKKIRREQAENEYGAYMQLSREKSKQITHSDALLDGELLARYLQDVETVTAFAQFNRKTIANAICEAMHFDVSERFSCIHNYIDTEHAILRKGAISARQGERVVIPLNMRDGLIIGTGKGDPEWNFSAPHGAGRVCTRQESRYTFSVEMFQKEMEGIYTTTANQGTIDECPMAYKPPERIISFLAETIDIIEIAKPIYNFKAC